MPEMDDYSGPFKPDLRLDDLSKEFLKKLIWEYQYAWLHMSEAWFYAIQDRCGEEAANNCELVAWRRVGDRVNPRYAKLANVELNTVVDSLKLCQLPLDNVRADSLFPPGEWVIINPNHVIQTVRKCRSLEFFENHAPERIDWVCYVNERQIIKKYLVNPKIEVRTLKLPPRKSKDDISCQWEMWLKE